MDRRQDVGFVRPPEAPVFEPTWEEFRDPMNYIETIRPVGEKYGICKIRPPPSWAPPFAIDGDSFKFTPRIQKLNELEVLFRVKMNYLEQLIRFWKLQGIDLKIPVVERKALDLFSLHKFINEEGGFDIVNQNNKWPKIIQRLGFSGAKGISLILKSHYEKIVLPFDEFVKNALMPCPDDDECCVIKSCPEATENVPNSEQPDGESKPSVKVQTARRMGAKVSSNKEKTRLHCYSSGTKITITTSPVKTKTGLSPEKTDSELPESQYSSSADKYFCEVCDGGDDEEHMLLCDGCDDAYHMQCLTPALTDVPPGDWICPKCLAKECMKPLEVYGFEQSEQEYTLESFGSMADKFKSEHFSASPQQVPYPVVEKEFWRLVESPDENVVVEYGADIHAGEHGSGFPTEKTKDRFSGDEDYILSGWNLNNLPVQGSSLLQFVSVNISGMKVPWVYVGMCFASFSWHTEDHWSYSINYLHRGEPKTWYGVPGAKAELLEGCMKNLAPELFLQSPDLLHQLTTLMHPNTLMAHGVPIYRTDQEAGNFVITFPRAYHAGFNQGFNVAEAVNFCPADWIPMGRACVNHYRLLKRQCVFSHDELLCQIAENSGAVDITLAQHVYDDLQTALKNEQKFRSKLIEQGVGNLEKKIFELQEDDERQCAICKTTCFLSARKCSCRPDVMICIDHSERLCKCDPSNHCLVYRYGIDEMEALLDALKARALQLEEWTVRARSALEAKMEKRKDVTWFKDLISEVTSRNLPKTPELEFLKEAVANAEVCTEISRQLLDRKVRSSQKSSAEMRNVSRLSVRELENFCTRVDTLACTFKEALMFQDLLISINKFKRAADDILRSSSIPSVATLEFQIDWGTRLEVELPELTNLNEMLMMAKWMNDYERGFGSAGRCIALAELRKLKASGASLRPHPSFQSSLAKVMNLLAISENLEQRAAACTAPGCRTSIANLENIIKESELLGVALPHIPDIKALLSSAKEWIQKVNGVLSTNDRFLIPDEVESLLKQGEKLPLELDSLDILRKKLCAINIWKDKLNKVFSNHSDRELLQVLVREIDADESSPLVTGPETSGSVKAGNSVVVKLAKLRAQMLDALRREVSSSFSRLLEQVDDCGVCANNNKDDLDHIQQCITCAGKYFGCRNKSMHLHGSSQRLYICPTCRQGPRITIEDIQKLVSSYQQLGFLLSEGRAVVYISAEVLRWQNMARLTLSTDEMTSALKLLAYPMHNSRIWGREHGGGDKTRSDQRFTTDKLNKSSNEMVNYDWSEMEAAMHPIDLSLSSSRKEVLRSPTVDDLVQKLTSEGLVQQLMSMDLSMEAQASLKDLLLESQVLNIATEEAQVIAFLLFAAWQRAQIVETRRREEELRRKREEEERRRREEEEQRRREEELQRRREEELRRKREEEERQRKEEELRRKREEELRRLHEAELRKKEEEDFRRKKEAEELRRKKEEHELQLKREEELRKKLEEEELQKRKREELKRKKAEEELLAKASEDKRKREELKKMVESNVKKKKNLGDSKKETPTSQNKKGSVQRKRFQELQRYGEEEGKKFGGKDRLFGDDLKKGSVDDGEWPRNESVDKIPEKQDNKKKNSKNEENHEVETKNQKKAKKRKLVAVEECGSEQKKNSGKKAKGGLSVQKKPKCNQKKKKGRKKGSSDDDSDEEEDDDDDYSGSDGYGACASSNCLNPPGRNLDWVQCDSCDKWYHLVCQGLKPHQVSGSQPYFCPLCPSRSSKADPEVSKQNKNVDLDSSISSPKSKTVSAKKSSVKEKNCEVQKLQSITQAKATQKTDSAVQSQNRSRKKTAKNNKRRNSTASVQENRSAAAQELTSDKARNRKNSDVAASAPTDESPKKKTKATEKPAAAQKSFPSDSPPKTPKSPLKSPSLLSSWSQKFTHPAVLDDSDSRQDEGSKSTQKSCFSQYLYMPWLSDNSAFR